MTTEREKSPMPSTPQRKHTWKRVVSQEYCSHCNCVRTWVPEVNAWFINDLHKKTLPLKPLKKRKPK